MRRREVFYSGGIMFHTLQRHKKNRFNVNEVWPVISHRGKEVGSGLPVCLREGMETVSGENLQQVRVHYNSVLPQTVNAHAYAQGQNIYLAKGQEHHLPHELGHVVQQMQGMVEPTMEVNGVAVNDDQRLEEHATILGDSAVRACLTK